MLSAALIAIILVVVAFVLQYEVALNKPVFIGALTAYLVLCALVIFNGLKFGDALGVTGALMSVFGFGLMVGLLLFVPINAGSVWLFFIAVMFAMTAISIPVMRFLDRRFAKTETDASIILRRSSAVGIFAMILTWLQIRGTFNLFSIVFVAVGVVLLAFFLELRESARWRNLMNR